MDKEDVMMIGKMSAQLDSVEEKVNKMDTKIESIQKCQNDQNLKVNTLEVKAMSWGAFMGLVVSIGSSFIKTIIK